MKIIPYPKKIKDLKPGDLFTHHPVWEQMDDLIGLKVYIRTMKECPILQANEDVYLIEVIT